ncbi:MAG: glycerate kinase [Verrucomicrobiae bacterium]|nr:glycerate kinase [Verrucomicrobiae bacterium]
MPRRFLVAPDKFKGSLGAEEAAAAIAAGIRRMEPDAEIDFCPIADGGEGFTETVHSALGGRWITCDAVDARGRPISSRYLLTEDDTAVIGMAETAGIWRLTNDERHPLTATTRGVGMQIRHAVERHRSARFVLGIGGSATNDGGSGMAAELGIRFLGVDGAAVDPLPANLPDVREIRMLERIPLPSITAACDVDNLLLGPRGATAVFSRQKGATEDDRPRLESALSHLVSLTDGVREAETPGAGAAGGLGFGLLRFAGARLVPGFELLAGVLGLEQRIQDADLVITGEGSLDEQSLGGKGPVSLAKMAGRHGVPVLAYCGDADEVAQRCGLFAGIHPLTGTGLPLDALMTEAASVLTALVASTLPVR